MEVETPTAPREEEGIDAMGQADHAFVLFVCLAHHCYRIVQLHSGYRFTLASFASSSTIPPPASDLRRQRTPDPDTSSDPTGPGSSSSQTPVMHHAVIGQHGDHALPQALMADPAHPLLPNHHPPVPPALAARHAVAEQQQRLGRDELRLPQPRDDPRLVDNAVSAAHAPAEVRL